MDQIQTLPQTWLESGYCHLPGFFSNEEHESVVRAVDEIIEWSDTPGKWMRYYENANDAQKQLCRIENFINYHEVLKNLAMSPRFLTMLEQLIGEPPVLFKEKINFKFPGGGGFAAHQDAPAFTSFDQDYHVTLLIPIDPFIKESGCLEIVKNKNKNMLDMADDLSLSSEVCATMDWQHLECQTGDILIFDSYMPHRSGPNHSQQSRRGLFLTFNKASAGDCHDAYYDLKRKTFPQDCEREPGVIYDSGVFNVANPIN
jgi:ectoine hydroxylase-related dioxygenase (phytanoyl-CoA dioxygenase family)